VVRQSGRVASHALIRLPSACLQGRLTLRMAVVPALLPLSQPRRPMAGKAVPERPTWQMSSVIELVSETPRARSIVLEVPDWPGHRPGQHIDIRLTASDGYQAQRSYAVASAPEDGYVVLTVEKVDGGEVSPYLCGELAAGDTLEVRGPIGSFAWEQDNRLPVLLLADGAGIVPFRSMLRHCAAVKDDVPVRLHYSARSLADLIYYDELLRLAAYDEVDIRLVLTHEWPEGWKGRRGPIDRRQLREAAWPPGQRPLNFICGPAEFVEKATAALVADGHDPQRVRSERFAGAGE
jgi:ferredoxin-NADP reductase